MADLSFGITEKALYLREYRAQILASNLVNASTPGYKAQDFDFDEAINASFDENFNAKPTLNQRNDHVFRSDGNTVDEDRERIEYAKNSLEYMASLSILQNKFSQLNKVIRGDGG